MIEVGTVVETKGIDSPPMLVEKLTGSDIAQVMWFDSYNVLHRDMIAADLLVEV